MGETAQRSAVDAQLCHSGQLAVVEERTGVKDKASSPPSPKLSETVSTRILAPLALSGPVSQAFLMMPGENEFQVAGDKPSPKLPRLQEVPLCLDTSHFLAAGSVAPLDAEQEEEVPTCSDQHKPRPKLNRERTVCSGICKSSSPSLGEFIALSSCDNHTAWLSFPRSPGRPLCDKGK